MEDEYYKYERLTVGILKEIIKDLEDCTEVRVGGARIHYAPVPIIETYLDEENKLLELLF